MDNASLMNIRTFRARFNPGMNPTVLQSGIEGVLARQQLEELASNILADFCYEPENGAAMRAYRNAYRQEPKPEDMDRVIALIDKYVNGLGGMTKDARVEARRFLTWYRLANLADRFRV